MAQTVEHEIGPVGILVNNAGVGMSGRFTDMSLEDWNRPEEDAAWSHLQPSAK